MNADTDMPEETYHDDIVCFLAERYHTTPHKILQRFLEQNTSELSTENPTFYLEKNEMEMLRDIIYSYHN